MNFVTSISLVVLGAMFLALLGWGSIRAAWRNCEGRRGVFAALAILAAICSIVAQKPSPDTPTITVDALLRDVGCYATNNVFHAAVTNAPSYAGVDFSDCDLMVYARERASSDAASWFELTPRKKFSQQPADYAIENATNFNYMVYLNYVPPSPVHTNGVFELYGFVIENEAQGEPDQLAAGFINSRAVPLPFDAEVEFLESTGTQWIDTGWCMQSDDMRFESEMMRTANGGLANFFFGYRFVNSAEYRGDMRAFFIYGANPIGRIAIRYGVNADNSSSIIPLNTKVSVLFDGTSLSVDGVVFASLTRAYTPASYGTMFLFDCNTGDTYRSDVSRFIGRMYSFKIWQGDVLVRDYIAVRKSGVGYLYDRVSGQLFGNAGTGNFGYGNDK